MPQTRGVTRAAMRNIRRHERSAMRAIRTNDSYQNFAARLGIGADTLASASGYGFNPITRNRTLLEWMYRGSWIVGQAVDTVAEDMTKAGISFTGDNDPKQIDQLQRAFVRKQVHGRFQSTIKWSRLYGGAIAVVMINGQKPSDPLDVTRIARGSFQGLLVMDRWMVQPTMSDLVTDPADPDLGYPRFYEVVADAPALPRMKVHHSRCVVLQGVELPYWQRISENLWGMSVIERIYDRLVAFDSGTQGASQLLYKAYLRTLKIPQLRNIVASGGQAYEGLIKQVQLMRSMQSNEGISIIDADDDFKTDSYSFSGVADTLLQFGQQLSGALQIPLVRLFGQSPSGLNSTGESDLRTYYDGINQRQETQLRHGYDVVSRVCAASEGVKVDEGFGFDFNPLWQLDDKEKVEIAERVTNTVIAAEATGMLPPGVALKELKQSSVITGVWSNITDEQITAAESAPAPGAVDDLLGPLALAAPGGQPMPGVAALPAPKKPGFAGTKPKGGAPQGAKDHPLSSSTGDAGVDLPFVEHHGLEIMIENHAGTRRVGPGWSVVMPAHYGYIRRTGSAEGEDEGMDCFLGPNADSAEVYVIDQYDPITGRFDEHKCMMGFSSATDAALCYRRAYDDGLSRMGGVTHMQIDHKFHEWLHNGDHSKPLAVAQARRAAG